MGWTAHDTDLYTLGKGIAMFDLFDANGLPTGLRDMGNAPSVSLTPTVEDVKHYSSRESIKKVDKVVNISSGITLKFTLDEYDKHNIALALLGTVSGNDIFLLDVGQIEGEFRFYGDPSAGPKYNFYLWKVLLKCNTELNFISDDWATIPFEAEVQDDTTNHPDSPYGLIQQIVGS